MKRQLFLVLALGCSAVAAADPSELTQLASDRAAIEQVYYNHRTGTKSPFAEAMSRETIEKLIRQDCHKEAVLKKVYGVKISPAQTDAELQRINTTTRAPEVLAELKAALDDDNARFARTVVRPIIVERLLRERFENDDSLHAASRRKVEQIRNGLLAARQQGASLDKLQTLFKAASSNEVVEVKWELGARPVEDNKELAEIQTRFGPQAQIISNPDTANKPEKRYFEELPRDLQEVLRVQLTKASDISAVIETSSGFLLCLARERTPGRLTVLSLTVPKRSYEQWLESQVTE